jgi:hypothetical protein
MSKLHIQTQVYENYGAHDWDGQGQCPQYWKAKGGSDYMVSLDGVKGGEFFDKRVEMIVDSVRSQIEETSEYYTETIIGYDVVADDFLTEFEQDQLDYEGVIRHKAKELTWA